MSGINVDKHTMDDLFAHEERLRKELKQLTEAIEVLQNHCEHNFQEHGPLKQCTICRKTERI